MANFLIEFVFVLLAILIWQFLASLLMRPFGVRLPLQPFGKNRRRALQLLTFSQHVWGYGVLMFGCGMFIAMTLLEHIDCKYGNVPCTHFSRTVRVYAVMWPLMGLFMGAVHGSDNRNRRDAAAPPTTGKHE